MVLGLAMLLVKDIDIANLQIGMIPAEQIIERKHQDGTVYYEKRQVTFSGGITDNIIVTPSATGLSQETITELKKTCGARRIHRIWKSDQNPTRYLLCTSYHCRCTSDCSLSRSILSAIHTTILTSV